MGEAARGGVTGEAAVTVVEPDGEGAIGEGFVEDEVEVSVVIEVNGKKESRLSDGETGDIGTAVAIEIGSGPDGLGQVSQSRGGGEDKKKEQLHLN